MIAWRLVSEDGTTKSKPFFTEYEAQQAKNKYEEFTGTRWNIQCVKRG